MSVVNNKPLQSQHRKKETGTRKRKGSTLNGATNAKLTKLISEKRERSPTPIDELENIQKIFSQTLDLFDYDEYLDGKRGRKSLKDNEDLECVKRIEVAYGRDICEIATLELFNFQDPLCNYKDDKVDVRVDFVVLRDDTVFSSKTLFDSSVPSTQKYKRDENVVFVELDRRSHCVASEMFLVAEMKCEGLLTNNRRGSVSVSTQASTQKTFYGARCIASRKPHENIHFKHGLSAITMIEINDKNLMKMLNNIRSPESIKILDQMGARRVHDGPSPSLHYELSDQHCEYDWDTIFENYDKRQRLRSARYGMKPTLSFIHKKECRTPTPDKENSVPKDKTADFPTVLMEMREIRCPFTLKPVDSVENLVEDLNRRIKMLRFEVHDKDQIRVHLAEGVNYSDDSIKPDDNQTVEIMDGYGASNAPFFPGRTIVDGNFEKSVRNLDTSGWYEEHSYRRISEFIDATQKEKTLMIAFNNFLSSSPSYAAISHNMKRSQVMQFFTNQLAELLPQVGPSLIMVFCMKLQKESIITNQDFMNICSQLV